MTHPFTKYVWYKDRYWRVGGTVDRNGRLELVRLFDDSQGINADPKKILNASQEQIDAIERIYQKGGAL